MSEIYLTEGICPGNVAAVEKYRSMRYRGVINYILHIYLQVRCLYRAAEKDHTQQSKKETMPLTIHDKLSLPAHISANRSISLKLRGHGQAACLQQEPVTGACLPQLHSGAASSVQHTG